MSRPADLHHQPRKILFSGSKHEDFVECARKNGFIPHFVSESHLLHVLLHDEPFDFLFIPGNIARFIALFLEGIPAAAWIVDHERRILLQNLAAEREWQTKRGEFCYLAIHGGRALPEKYQKMIQQGKRSPEIQCIFCRANEALTKQAPVRTEIEWEGRFFDVFWVPLGKDLYLHYAHDITSYRKLVQEIQCLATTDPLTGVCNRYIFMDILKREIQRAERYRRTFALAFFDLDNFKLVNDSLGHMKGDQLLKEVIAEIRADIRKIDTLARFGGDEFVILFPDITAAEAEHAIKRLRARIAATGERHGLPLGASFGLAEYIPGDTPESLLCRADALMYREKVARKPCR